MIHGTLLLERNHWDHGGLPGRPGFNGTGPINANLTFNIGLRYDIYGWFRERHDDLATFNPNGMNPQVPFLGRIDYVATSRHPSRTFFPAHKDDLGPRFSFAWSPFGNKKTVIRGGYGLIYSNSIGAQFLRDTAGASSAGYTQALSYIGDGTGQRPVFRFSDGAPPLPIVDLSTIKQNDNQLLATGPFYFLQGSKDPYVQQWSLFIQRELPGNLMVNIGYVGTHGSHLIGDTFRTPNYVHTATRLRLRYGISQQFPVDHSIATLYPGICDATANSCPGSFALVPYPQYTYIFGSQGADGFNRYNSFQARVEKRYSQGLNFIAAYTFQKNITTPNTGALAGILENPTNFSRGIGRAGQVVAGLGYGFTVEDPDNRRRYAALAADDITHILNAAVTYELPFGNGKPFFNRGGGTAKVLGGWKLTQNWNFQSGVPLQISGPCDAISCHPNVIGDASRGRSSKNKAQRQDQWFDPGAFEAPFGSDPATIQAVSTGTYPNGTPFNYSSDIYWRFGNAGFRVPSARSPGFWNPDFALIKDVHLTESRYFQFRWELYNALNHQNLGLPTTSWCLPPNPDGSTDAIHRFGCQFGRITNIQTDARNMQFGLKFYW